MRLHNPGRGRSPSCPPRTAASEMRPSLVCLVRTIFFSDRGFSVGDSRPRLVAGLRCQLSAVIDLGVDSAVPQWLGGPTVTGKKTTVKCLERIHLKGTR